MSIVLRYGLAKVGSKETVPKDDRKAQWTKARTIAQLLGLYASEDEAHKEEEQKSSQAKVSSTLEEMRESNVAAIAVLEEKVDHSLKAVVDRLDQFAQRHEPDDLGTHAVAETNFNVPGGQRLTYAQAAAGAMNRRAHEEAISAARTADSRILVTSISDVDWSASKHVLTEDANKALCQAHTARPLDNKMATIVGIRKLSGGQALCVFKSVEEVLWLEAEGGLDTFAKAWVADMSAKPNFYEVIVEFVPVQANLGDCFEMMRIESDSGIEAANKAIKDGLFIAGKPVLARKPDNFLGLCTKCYKPGHIRVTCTCQVDVCGRCAGEHRTPTCNAGAREFWCSECNEAGHGAAQTDKCSTYIWKNGLKQKRNLEAKYKFYVMEEHWTWLRVDQEVEDGTTTWEEKVRDQTLGRGWRMAGGDKRTSGGHQRGGTISTLGTVPVRNKTKSKTSKSATTTTSMTQLTMDDWIFSQTTSRPGPTGSEPLSTSRSQGWAHIPSMHSSD
ncbi:hypothetical protein K435DRAFT_854284 [Dendrothele bispora CBS 962.96]|uniref:Uncharacterized protein n=1 Tax=Dendrothele bispora (strain CBS 962.96) TaxID=1314807 RepID=A0A4S8MEB3_DENBC|nr:hypothetical protein K435DRAFT_854284 [Dendrothele bispora CBS 962.96]